MKTTKEMIEVMQAYERGEQIQVKTPNKKCKWEDIKEPDWQWNFCDYRVKPKKKYVPFETAEEFLAAQREHGMYVFFVRDKYTAFINANGIIRLTLFDNASNVVVSELEYMLEDCTFLDGTPCGKEVVE